MKYCYHVQIISDNRDEFQNDNILKHFHLFFGHFSKSGCPGQLGKHFWQPTSYFDHVRIISDDKNSIKKNSDFR